MPGALSGTGTNLRVQQTFSETNKPLSLLPRFQRLPPPKAMLQFILDGLQAL